MTQSDSSGGSSGQARRDLVRGALAVMGFIALSLAVLLWQNPIVRWQLARSIVAPKAEVPLHLTIAHTNDTWGYTQPCG